MLYFTDMSGTQPPFKASNNAQANAEYATAQKEFSAGNFDTALTWYRRAVISDPTFVAAHLQIGQLCRDKAKLDKMFLRYAYDAFYKAAGLDLTNEDAHNQFIIMASSSGRFEELLVIYEKWASANPSNELIQRCKRNVVTMGMSFMPQSTDIGETSSQGLKRFVLISSIFLFVVGLGILTVFPVLVKTKKIKPENVRGAVPAGLAMSGFGLIGFLGRRFL